MRNYQEYTIFDGQSATGVGKIALCDDFTHAVASIHTTGSANFTLKFAGSIQESSPNFANAQSPTNAYDFVRLVDLDDGTAIAGDTGISSAGTDVNRLVEININALRWITARVTAHSAGAITVKIRLYTNE